MNKILNCTLIQDDFIVGAPKKNLGKILSHIDAAVDNKMDLIVFPELCLIGYPAEDLLYRDELYQQVCNAIEAICQRQFDITIIRKKIINLCSWVEWIWVIISKAIFFWYI